MRKIFLFIAISMSISAFSQMKWNTAYQQYINQYKDIAIEQMQRYRIPASITLAQGLLESAAGRSELTRNSNNHFGIKCNNNWTGRRTYHDDDAKNDCFRVYDSAYESYEDHSKFLSGNQRYRPLFQLKVTDYKGWAKGLKACGYATSPTYATRLIEIIELYKLYRYDTQNHVDKYQLDQVRHQGSIRRQVYEFNNNYYVIARKGDTFRSVAEDVDVSYRKLAKFNERDKNDVLEEGEMVWLQKKRRKAPKEYKGLIHLIEDGESMYSISQKYGIRLKNLYKINHLDPDFTIRVGYQLRLR